MSEDIDENVDSKLKVIKQNLDSAIFRAKQSNDNPTNKMAQLLGANVTALQFLLDELISKD